jgi:sulfide dehydrogenase cytochrome subunit
MTRIPDLFHLRKITVTTTVLLLTGSSTLFAAPISDTVKQCETCHGQQGNNNEEKVPNIAGISHEYLQESLEDFKHEKRKGDRFKAPEQKETDMNEVTRNLSDAEIASLAKHFSRNKFIPRKQPFDTKLAKKGKKIYERRCERCHEDSGRSSDDDMGRLAGQPMEYLKEQMEEFMSAERKPPKKMAKQLKKLKPGDITPLLHFFASQQD